MSSGALTIRQVRKVFGDNEAISPLDLDVEAGEFVSLQAYTSGSAWQLRLDRDYGCIAPGAVANLAVANRNPFEDISTGQPTSICTTENVLTIECGEIVYDGR